MTAWQMDWRKVFLSLTLTCAGAGCGHTHVATDTSATTTADHAQPPVDPTSVQLAHPHAQPPSDAPPPTGIPLSMSPAGELKPGAARMIQDALIARGKLKSDYTHGTLDGPTTQALREIQRGKGLPATGIPDDATVGLLGLKPSDVFRSATPTPK